MARDFGAILQGHTAWASHRNWPKYAQLLLADSIQYSHQIAKGKSFHQ